MPTRRRLSAPFAASPASCARRQRPRRPRRSSRPRRRHTRCSPTPSGAGPMTPTATRAFARAGFRPEAGSDRSRTSSRRSSAALRVRGADRAMRGQDLIHSVDLGPRGRCLDDRLDPEPRGRPRDRAAARHPGPPFALRGHGLPGSNGGPPGDLVIAVRVLVPTDLSEEQREMAEKLSESGSGRTSPAATARRASSRASAAPFNKGPPPLLSRMPGESDMERDSRASGRVIRLAVRCNPEQASPTVLAPNGVEEERGPGYVEYAIYGGEGELRSSARSRRRRGMVEVVSTEVPDDWADRWQDATARSSSVTGCTSVPHGRGRARARSNFVVDPGRAGRAPTRRPAHAPRASVGARCRRRGGVP